MTFSTAAILPSLIKTCPGASVGPDTVCTVAPVSRMVSAKEEETPDKTRLIAKVQHTAERPEDRRIPAAAAVWRNCRALFPLTPSLSPSEEERVSKELVRGSPDDFWITKERSLMGSHRDSRISHRDDEPRDCLQRGTGFQSVAPKRQAA